MQPISFQGYVKVGRQYINSDKITKIKEYRKSEGPTIVFFDNGAVEHFEDVKDTTKFVQQLNTVSITNGILDYQA